MISFDIINVIFKCCLRFKFCCLNYDVHTNLFELLVKGCGNVYKYAYPVQCFCSLSTSVASESHMVYVLIGTSYFYLFRLLMLFYLEIHQFLFFLFEALVRFIKLGIGVSLK